MATSPQRCMPTASELALLQAPITGEAIASLASDCLSVVTTSGHGFPLLNGRIIDFRSDDTQRLSSETSAAQVDFYDQKFGALVESMAGSPSFAMLERLAVSSSKSVENWCDALPECEPQFLSLDFLEWQRSPNFLQIGGHGQYAVAALMSGAGSAMLVTPIKGEAELFLALAEHFGVGDKALGLLCGAEAMPLRDGSIGAMYSCGSLHHTDTALALAEIDRCLSSGGRFSSIDPWRTPVYGLGIRVFGKREDVDCVPLDRQRLDIPGNLDGEIDVTRHSPLVRYALALGHQRGRTPSRGAAFRALRWEQRVTPKPVRSLLGSCVMVTLSKPG